MRPGSPRRTPRPYTLGGLLYCGICNWRMRESWNNDAANNRCVFLSQNPARNKIDLWARDLSAKGCDPMAEHDHLDGKRVLVTACQPDQLGHAEENR